MTVDEALEVYREGKDRALAGIEAAEPLEVLGNEVLRLREHKMSVLDKTQVELEAANLEIDRLRATHIVKQETISAHGGLIDELRGEVLRLRDVTVSQSKDLQTWMESEVSAQAKLAELKAFVAELRGRPENAFYALATISAWLTEEE